MSFGNTSTLTVSETLVILLAGGTKKQQQRDIDAAKQRWLDYKRRKKEEGSL